MAASRGWGFELELAGAGGEPVDLWRTLVSHGVANLPPMFADEDHRTLEVTVAIPVGRPRTVVVSAKESRHASVRGAGPRPGSRVMGQVRDAVAHLLRLDEDLSPFYAKAATDPALSWAAGGAGRMMRSQTVFEDVIKTICTTNCTWSATERMVGALVEHLGAPAVGARATGVRGRAFPTASAMVEAPASFYRDVARAGYRGAYLSAIARAVADGDLDLEVLGRTSSEDLPDGEVAERLLGLPGVGPYAAAHVMMMLGRYSSLILDSWTRPTYARLARRRSVTDATIVRRFRRYGPYAGLAFWLFLTRDWVPEPAEDAPGTGVP